MIRGPCTYRWDEWGWAEVLPQRKRQWELEGHMEETFSPKTYCRFHLKILVPLLMRMHSADQKVWPHVPLSPGQIFLVWHFSWRNQIADATLSYILHDCFQTTLEQVTRRGGVWSWCRMLSEAEPLSTARAAREGSQAIDNLADWCWFNIRCVHLCSDFGLVFHAQCENATYHLCYPADPADMISGRSRNMVQDIFRSYATYI